MSAIGIPTPPLVARDARRLRDGLRHNPAQLRELRRLRHENLPMRARTHTRARPHARKQNPCATAQLTQLRGFPAQPLAQLTQPRHLSDTMNEKVKMGRVLMPEVSGIVDELRAALGAQAVDAAIAAGQKARREHARIEAAQGSDAADRWLRRQRFPQGCFWAQEGEHEVGMRRP